MQIYTVPHLAHLLKASVPTVRRLIAEGHLKGRKVGKKWLVSEDALKVFLMNADSTAKTP